jgi:hypothetical protein
MAPRVVMVWPKKSYAKRSTRSAYRLLLRASGGALMYYGYSLGGIVVLILLILLLTGRL